MRSHTAYLNANIATVKPGEQTTWERWHEIPAPQNESWPFPAQDDSWQWAPTQYMAWEPATSWQPTQDESWQWAPTQDIAQPQAMSWQSATASGSHDDITWQPKEDEHDEAWDATQEALGSPYHHRGNRQGHVCL